MSRAIGEAAAGAGLIGGAFLLDVLTWGAAAPLTLEMAMLSAGIATEAGAIASAIGSKAGIGVTTRTPASLRQIIRGVQRVGGTIVYCSTTGSTNRQYNMIIAIAGHPCFAIENLYLDGRQVFWNPLSGDPGNECNRTINGYNFGGNSDSENHTGPNGDQYNFGGLVFCEAFYGNQNSGPDITSGVVNPTGGYSTALYANDPTWAPSQQPVGMAAAAAPVMGTGGIGGAPIASGTVLNQGGPYADGTVAIEIIPAPGDMGVGGGAVHGEVTAGVMTIVVDTPGLYEITPSFKVAPPSTATSTPYLGGCTYVYLKIEADSSTFPQFPEIRFTVHGKSDIWDPRTSTRGFTTNWALHVADVLTDPTWGLGDNSVNQDQLIAAANVCDEQVSCAAGSEAQFALNMHYDAGSAPGDVIDRMMAAAAGRLSRIGGEWFVWPAYWQGPSATFDENSLLDTIQWTSRKPLNALSNRVTGTYTAPNFPYNVAGNLYDSNGYFNGQTQNNFPFAFQPTSFPMYAADLLHGYDEDVYLVADTPNQGAFSSIVAYAAGAVIIYNGVPWQANEAVPAGNAPGALDGDGNPYWSATGNYLPMEIDLSMVLSVSQAQRIAKILMLRNRQQGSGTMVMSAAALLTQPLDVIQFNLSAMGWSDKLLEICGQPGQEYKWRYGAPPGSDGEGKDSTPALYVEVPVCETDESVYEWDDATEELTPYDIPAQGGGNNPFMVGAPSGLSAVSDLATALVQPDGTVTPRIELIWSEDSDTYVTNGGSIRIQITPHGTAAWADVLMLNGQAVQAYLGNVVSGSAYDVRIAGVRPSGAQSEWVELDNIVCGNALSSTNPTGSSLNPVAPAGTLSAVTPSSGNSVIIVSPFTASVGVLLISCLSAGPASITGLTPQQLYYVYYVDPSFAGGAITPIATQNTADFVGKPGYYLIGSIVTPAYAATPLYSPAGSTNFGLSAPTNPGNAYDGNLATYAEAYSYAYVSPTAWAEVLWGGFPIVPAGAGQQLNVKAAVVLEGSTTTPWAITASIGYLSGADTLSGGAKPVGQLGTLNPRGAWAATTAYALWDTFTQGGLTYLVVTGYTSGSSFGNTDLANTCVILASGTGAAAVATYSVPLATGMYINEVSVDVTVNAQTASAGSLISTTVEVYEIYIQ